MGLQPRSLFSCSRSSPASYLEAGGTLGEGLFPAAPALGWARTKVWKQGVIRKAAGIQVLRGQRPIWVWMFSSLCTRRTRKRKLWSPEAHRKQSPRDWKCSPRLWRETCYLETQVQALGWEDPLEEAQQLTPVCKECPGINYQSVKKITFLSHYNPIIMVLHENKQGGQ